jgi:transposase
MTRNKQTIEVVTVSEERRRRWSADEKAALVRETYEPGMTVSLVARKHGVGASQLFNWRKLEREGALTAVSAGESVVPASELAAARAQIAQLQRMLAPHRYGRQDQPWWHSHQCRFHCRYQRQVCRSRW